MPQISDANFMAGKNLKWLGILTLVLGILAMVTPLMTGLSVVVMVGMLVVFAGMARMFWAFRAGSLGRGLLQMAIGGLTLICGLIMVTDPLVASGVLTIMIAIYLVLDGGFEIVAALQARPAGGWGFLLAGGVISLLLGIMIWKQYPFSGAWALGLMLGFKLLLVGMAMVGVGRTIAADK